MIEKNNLEDLFNNLQGKLDTHEPSIGHRKRFLDKLNAKDTVVKTVKKGSNWWKHLSIAASVILLIGLSVTQLKNDNTRQDKVAEISPEVSNTQVYFANLIQEQVKTLQKESTPETKKIIDDTLLQLRKLEANAAELEQDLINGGNTKLILSAMIKNFQTRIDLLQDVQNQIEAIKNLKDYKDENYTI